MKRKIKRTRRTLQSEYNRGVEDGIRKGREQLQDEINYLLLGKAKSISLPDAVDLDLRQELFNPPHTMQEATKKAIESSHKLFVQDATILALQENLIIRKIKD